MTSNDIMKMIGKLKSLSRGYLPHPTGLDSWSQDKIDQVYYDLEGVYNSILNNNVRWAEYHLLRATQGWKSKKAASFHEKLTALINKIHLDFENTTSDI